MLTFVRSSMATLGGAAFSLSEQPHTASDIGRLPLYQHVFASKKPT
jgi:hypothetical protein